MLEMYLNLRSRSLIEEFLGDKMRELSSLRDSGDFPGEADMTDGLPVVNVPSIVESLLIFIFLCERVSLYNSESIYYNLFG